MFLSCAFINLIPEMRWYRPVDGLPWWLSSKESACNAIATGDKGSIPGLGRSLGEGIGSPFQYSWVSLVAHTVKNLPAMQETGV